MSQVERPSHYANGKIEVIEFIMDKDLNFNRGNVIKYVSRAGKKDPAKDIEDLEKAMVYLKFEIARIKGEGNFINPMASSQLERVSSWS